MNYTEAVKDITSQGKFRIDLGLDRVRALMELLGNPQDNLKCIQVAGTNGKGSVCTMLASIFKEAGYKTGLYTSPHIFEYTERISINGIYISKEDFGKYYENIVTLAKENEINPTEFEILTAIMYKYFADNSVDIAVIETGLGGRFDATNILKTNLCAIITHIDLDHTDRLGDTKDKIAFEKAGIIKPNSTVITSEGYETIKDKADEVDSLLLLTSPLVPPKYTDALSLKGEEQQDNLALVLETVKYLFKNITEETIINGLKKVKNPCRFQYIKEKNLIIDGAHNPNCFYALHNNLQYFYDIPKQYVFGCLDTKDYKKMLSYLLDDNTLEQLYIFPFNNAHACDFDTIKTAVSELRPDIRPQILTNLRDILNPDILTVVCGSFYMIEELADEELKQLIMG